ncbi:MAG: dTDP-4-dehydrorhamnose reductase [Xanthobacteraceae bacterium]|nr:dTDP-4-dehydrorhamnose reductase [Xanthobacteraceae bacterium]
MRVLVTGVTGQVGGALLTALDGKADVVPAPRAVLDLAQGQMIASALDRMAPDLIINPAAYTAVDRAEDERDLAYRINGEAPGHIASWAARRNVPSIHLSTDYVYDGAGERAWREDDITGPLGVYGASKLAGEDAIRAAKGPHLIIRTSWVYAAKGTNFLRTIARLAAERPELRIVADQVGAPTSAQVIADSIATLVAKHASDLPRRFAAADGLVHLAAAGETSWHGFATAIVDGLRARGAPLKAQSIVPIRTEDYPTKTKRPANSRLDLTRLQRVFGVTTPHWSQALAAELDVLARELAPQAG